MSDVRASAIAFPRKRVREINRPSGDVGAESTLVVASARPRRRDRSGGVAAPSRQFQRSMPFPIGSESWRPTPQPRRSSTGRTRIAAEHRWSSPPELLRPKLRPRLSNVLPFSGLGAAKPAPRFYAKAPAATRSAATACSTALSAQRPVLAVSEQLFAFQKMGNGILFHLWLL